MTAGDILDYTFRLYRKNFVTMAGIVAVISLPLLILNLASTLYFLQTAGLGQSTNPFLNPSFAADPASLLPYFGASGLIGLLGAIASVFQTAALSIVVSERFLGRTITIGEAYRRALRRWLSLFLVILIAGMVFLLLGTIFVVPFIGIFALIGTRQSFQSSPQLATLAMILPLFGCLLFIPAIIALVLFSTRWAFATQAVVLEDQNSTGALRRSWRLVGGSFWRVLGIIGLIGILIYVLSLAITAVAGVIFFVVPSLVVRAAANTLLTGMVGILLTPIQIAALTLLYYDLRIRKEGFDLELLSGQIDAK